VLLTTATDLGAPGVDDIYGWGLINLKKAIEGPGLLRVDTDVVMNQRAGGTRCGKATHGMTGATTSAGPAA
jgi:subtilase-type serine protease